MSSDGVLVLMDLGSALMSAELAVELLEGASGPVRLSDAPLVEGDGGRCGRRSTGASLEEVAAEARGALAMKAAQIGADDSEPRSRAGAGKRWADSVASGRGCSSETRSDCMPDPAARFVETVGRVRRRGTGRQGRLGATAGQRPQPDERRGARCTRAATRSWFSSSGPQAREATGSTAELASEGFGDGLPAPEPGTVVAWGSAPPVAPRSVPPADSSGCALCHRNALPLDTKPSCLSRARSGERAQRIDQRPRRAARQRASRCRRDLRRARDAARRRGSARAGAQRDRRRRHCRAGHL